MHSHFHQSQRDVERYQSARRTHSGRSVSFVRSSRSFWSHPFVHLIISAFAVLGGMTFILVFALAIAEGYKQSVGL